MSLCFGDIARQWLEVKNVNYPVPICILNGDAENARHETMGKETTAPKFGVEIAREESVAQKCRGAKCEKWKQWHNVAESAKMRDMNIWERQSMESC